MTERLTAAIQVGAVLLAVGVAWLATKYVIYPALGVPAYAPMILRPILGFVTAWFALRLGGERWSQFGLTRPTNVWSFGLSVVLLYTVVVALNRYVIPPVAGWFNFQNDPSIMGYIRGNEIAFLGWLAVSWLVGGFSEELLFRGFLLNKVAAMAGSDRFGLALGVAAQAVLFGLLHLYQGAFGFVFAFAMALVFGLGYLACSRNLWPLIVVHGTWNSAAIYEIYAA
jgi:CAAX protease family protein